MPRLLLRTSRILLAIVLTAITLLSLSPSAPASPGDHDKLAHLLAYTVVAFLLVLSTRKAPNRIAGALAFLGITIVYGVMIEFVQQFTGREFDVADMAANALGATIGTVLGLVARRVVGDSDGTADR